MSKLTVEQLVELINEVDSSEPIDWGMLNINENDATKMIAINLLDQYNKEWSMLEDSDFRCAMLATVGKLVLENFVLNLKLIGPKS